MLAGFWPRLRITAEPEGERLYRMPKCTLRR